MFGRSTLLSALGALLLLGLGGPAGAYRGEWNRWQRASVAGHMARSSARVFDAAKALLTASNNNILDTVRRGNPVEFRSSPNRPAFRVERLPGGTIQVAPRSARSPIKMWATIDARNAIEVQGTYISPKHPALFSTIHRTRRSGTIEFGLIKAGGVRDTFGHSPIKIRGF